MKIIKRIALILLLVFFLFLGLFVIPYFANIVMPWQRAEAINTALEWGGLKELPHGSEVISVETKGSSLTREFIIEFTCEPKALQTWMQESGLNQLTPVEEWNGLRVYQVAGKEGAIGGKVFADYTEGRVVIDVSWS
ncbi:MAG TPA: hypothetical protein PK325_10725 [Cyclobacteriaceae bacterium]|nr:hypothetical protein [Cyclobacteriaceae bacterium]HMV09219.1 hypothetical protein [Cyclobacteriaceae bacterium]HMV90843.1 hypothetical protein [Cyclobacteriaceae bacterium]HMX01412.1 hypothetical protein [Cyclobacteriaceae bacterium]HMX50318.1 hypothetical protein [Cyclobacteriaceae bacterium]